MDILYLFQRVSRVSVICSSKFDGKSVWVCACVRIARSYNRLWRVMSYDCLRQVMVRRWRSYREAIISQCLRSKLITVGVAEFITLN